VRPLPLLPSLPRNRTDLRLHGDAEGCYCSAEGQGLREYIEQNGHHHANGAGALAKLIYDPVSAGASEAQIHEMAMRFDEIILFDELTIENYASG
jgi:hypothetical protein